VRGCHVAEVLCGLLGGVFYEACDLRKAIRRVRGWPWRSADELDLCPYLMTVLIRLLAAGVAVFLVNRDCTLSSWECGLIGMAPEFSLSLLGRLSVRCRALLGTVRAGVEAQKRPGGTSVPLPPTGESPCLSTPPLELHIVGSGKGVPEGVPSSDQCVGSRDAR
jgi:hypothetical protein